MQLARAAQLLEAEPLFRNWNPNLEVEFGAAADLMSDVLSLAKPGSVLVTGLTNPQVIRTAEVAQVAAIVLVRGKEPMPETAAMALEARIPLFATSLTMFEACGRLYAAGMKPTSASYGVSSGKGQAGEVDASRRDRLGSPTD
jgi:hypothetical protein